jgi:Carboxylesterase family
MHKSERILCPTLCALIAVVATFMQAQEVVSIETGLVQGSNEGGITSFKGIPYAVPPVEDLR